MHDVDPNSFRHAAGQFVTGVTIVTTVDDEDRPVGLTVNSFTSVSLDPPMVLFCLGLGSDTYDAFSSTRGFVVNVLNADQVDLSRRFSSPNIDRFDGVLWEAGHHGMPVIDNVRAVFECDLESSYPAGDHRVMVGRVAHIRIGDLDQPALGYFRSAYVSASDNAE